MHHGPYIPRSYYPGGITLEALLMGLVGIGMPPVAAAYSCQVLIRADDVVTEPALPAPAEIRAHDDGKTFAVITAIETYDPKDVRVFSGRARPAPCGQFCEESRDGRSRFTNGRAGDFRMVIAIVPVQRATARSIGNSIEDSEEEAIAVWLLFVVVAATQQPRNF